MDVILSIGSKVSAPWSGTMGVKVSDVVPRSLTLALAPAATGVVGMYDATLTWIAPVDMSNTVGYVIKFTSSPNGWGSWTDKATVPVGTTTHLVVRNVSQGGTLRAKVGMAYSTDTATPTQGDASTWAPNAFTADQLIQACDPALKPTISTLSFIGLSHGFTDRADMLMRFKTASFNGGDPDLGLINYNAVGANQSLGGAAFKLTSELTQFGVLTKFPINVLANVVLSIETLKANGLPKAADTLRSEASDVVKLRVRVPRPVLRPTVALQPSVAPARATNVSVAVTWTSAEEEAGNAPITGHVIRMRLAVDDFLCESESSGASLVCSRPSVEDSAYSAGTFEDSGGAIAGVPVGATACFIVFARNEIGKGASSATEACIDVRPVCSVGTVINDKNVYACEQCPPGTFAPLGLSTQSCVDCSVGTIPNEAQSACSPCRVGTYATRGASTCAECGTRGMDCSGGEIKLKDGWWFGTAGDNISITGSTFVYECLNPAACQVVGATQVLCVKHAGGPLCAVCDDGYVPDAAALDGRCKFCDSTPAERWSGKILLLLGGAVVVFLAALVAVTQPKPGLKIDPFLVTVNVRRLLRRARKRALLRLLERDLKAAERKDEGEAALVVMSEEQQLEYRELLKGNQIDKAVELRRAVYGASAAGHALATIAASRRISAAAIANAQLDASVVAERVADHFHGTDVTDETTSGVQENIRRGSILVEQLSAAAVSEDAAPCCAAAVAGARSFFARAGTLIAPGQMQLMMGNLQINASLSVVFTIPWPVNFMKWIDVLSFAKLDIFKGLAIATPCLHSSHFMSLAMFVAIPAVLGLVFAAAFGIAFALAVIHRTLLARKKAAHDAMETYPEEDRNAAFQAERQRRKSCPAKTWRKLKCMRFTVQSARSAAIKLNIVLLMVIYPTICSKVFTTFKCVEINDGASSTWYMAADMSIRCFTDVWNVWATVAALSMALYVVGIPLGLVVLLFIARRRGTLHFPSFEHSAASGSSSTASFKGEDEADAAVGVAAEARGNEHRVSDVLRAVRRTEEFFHHRTAYGNLYENYEQDFWWFEFSCTMRKMLLTGALVLFGASTTPQVVSALAVCILWFALIANLKPYQDAVDDRLAQVEGLQVLFTLLIGLVLQLEAANELASSSSSSAASNPSFKSNEEGLGVLLILLNVVVVGLALLQQPLFLIMWRCIAERVRDVRGKVATQRAGDGGAEQAPARVDGGKTETEQHLKEEKKMKQKATEVTELDEEEERHAEEAFAILMRPD